MANEKLRMELSDRQGGQCAMCGKPLEDISLCDIGRITPKREGGTYEIVESDTGAR